MLEFTKLANEVSIPDETEAPAEVFVDEIEEAQE
jgi:hypothetical protein